MPAGLGLGVVDVYRRLLSCSLDKTGGGTYWWVDFGSALTILDPDTMDAPTAELAIVDARVCPPALIAHMDVLQVLVIGQARVAQGQSCDPTLWGPMPTEVLLAGS